MPSVEFLYLGFSLAAAQCFSLLDAFFDHIHNMPRGIHTNENSVRTGQRRKKLKEEKMRVVRNMILYKSAKERKANKKNGNLPLSVGISVGTKRR